MSSFYGRNFWDDADEQNECDFKKNCPFAYAHKEYLERQMKSLCDKRTYYSIILSKIFLYKNYTDCVVRCYHHSTFLQRKKFAEKHPTFHLFFGTFLPSIELASVTIRWEYGVNQIPVLHTYEFYFDIELQDSVLKELLSPSAANDPRFSKKMTWE